MYYSEQKYDHIQFRVIPFVVGPESMYTLVEEKVLNGKVVADTRRQLDYAQFMKLRAAVLMPDRI